MGLVSSVLSPILKIGTTLANFSSLEKTPSVKDVLVRSSSSSCHQTSVFHLSTHFFAASLNLLRSSNEQGCARRVHCIMCAVFSVARAHSQVVSPS